MINNNKEIWRKTIISTKATLQEAITNLNNSSLKIIMVVNEKSEFKGTISDGDIRRGILKGLNLNSSISEIIQYDAIVVPPEIKRHTVMQLMKMNKIYHVPVVNENLKIIGLYLWEEIIPPISRPNLMVVMAGGKGTRLLPHTQNCPKPMVPVSGKPMLEHIIERAKLNGFSHFIFAIHHLSQMIKDHFGNGDSMDVRIDYISEKSPLGTAGGLSLLNPKPKLPFIVTNGDVLTDIRYGEILDFHNHHSSSATMAVRIHEWQHPYGVVRMKGVDIVGFDEKPIARSHINAGIYVLSPEVLNEMEMETHCNMPALFERLQLNGKRTIGYPIHEHWIDLGHPEDLVKANREKII